LLGQRFLETHLTQPSTFYGKFTSTLTNKVIKMTSSIEDVYTDYLICSFGAVTATGLSAMLDGTVSHLCPRDTVLKSKNQDFILSMPRAGQKVHRIEDTKSDMN
jgi:hypothetical protein